MSTLQALDSIRPWARGGAREGSEDGPEARQEPEGEEDRIEDEAPVPAVAEEEEINPEAGEREAELPSVTTLPSGTMLPSVTTPPSTPAELPSVTSELPSVTPELPSVTELPNVTTELPIVTTELPIRTPEMPGETEALLDGDTGAELTRDTVAELTEESLTTEQRRVIREIRDTPDNPPLRRPIRIIVSEQRSLVTNKMIPYRTGSECSGRSGPGSPARPGLRPRQRGPGWTPRWPGPRPTR